MGLDMMNKHTLCIVDGLWATQKTLSLTQGISDTFEIIHLFEFFVIVRGELQVCDKYIRTTN